MPNTWGYCPERSKIGKRMKHLAKNDMAVTCAFCHAIRPLITSDAKRKEVLDIVNKTLDKLYKRDIDKA